MANINKLKISGTTYTIQDENATKTVELTQAQYDALAVKDPNTFYIITDATAGDLSNYYTKSETSGATEISTALNAKADRATTYTKTEVDNAITAGTSTKQDTLVSGTNIKTINNESILGSGNIEIQGGGGKAVTGGTNISVTTGETADTINCTLNITNGTGLQSIVISNGKATDTSSFAIGDGTKNQSLASEAKGITSFSCGLKTIANKNYSAAFGDRVNTNNANEFSCGRFNNSISASDTFGDSGNTLFSVGNGTANNARHNAFEIRQNGDIYITKDGQDVKLQDQLGGGGGGSITIDPNLDSGSTNAVANSAITNAIANATNGTLKEDLVFSATCGYGTIESNFGSIDGEYLRINIYPAKIVQFGQYRSWSGKYYYKCFVLDIETKTEYNAYWNVTYNGITSSGGTGINYVTLNLPDGRLKFTVIDDTKYRIIGFERDIHSSSSSRESYSTDSTYEVNIPSGTTTNELFQYIENVDRTKNVIGLTSYSLGGLKYQNFTDEIGGRIYYRQTIFPPNTSFTAHTANTTIHVTSTQTTAWDAKVDSSAITTSVTSSSTDAQVPSAKAVYDQFGGLKLVKLSQSEYDSLATKDNSTLYVIV